jgi:hypothetical protein
MPLMSGGSQGGGMTPEQMAAAQRLSSEQDALRKSLEEIQREVSGQHDILGRFDQTVEQMKQVSDDLKKGNINERTIKNQERILSRMLDAQKSLNERDYTRKREAQTGKDLVRKSPPALPEDLGQRKDMLSRDLLKVLSEPYPAQYEGAIREYFNALQQIEIPETND